MRIHVKWVTVFVGTAGFFPEHFGTPPAKLPTVNQYPGLQPIPEDQPSSALKTWTNGWGEINGPEKFKGDFSYCEWWFFIMLKSEFLMVKSHEIPLKERWWNSRPFVFPKKILQAAPDLFRGTFAVRPTLQPRVPLDEELTMPRRYCTGAVRELS